MDPGLVCSVELTGLADGLGDRERGTKKRNPHLEQLESGVAAEMESIAEMGSTAGPAWGDDSRAGEMRGSAWMC